MRKTIGLFLMAAICVALCSCKHDTRVAKPTYRVAGKVTVDGKPQADVKVVARSKEASDPSFAILPQGVTKEDGTFQLTSYEPGDGAPTGDYTLTFIWQEKQGLKYGGPDKLQKRYSDPEKSTFKIKVDKSPVDAGTYELTTK